MRSQGILVGLAVSACVLAGCSSDSSVPEAPAGPSEDASVPLNYVALGDSAASGPRIPDQVGAPGCQQSDSNYPHVLAEDLAVGSFVDVTCSGAVTENIVSTAQGTSSGEVPVQLDALTPETDLVTVTIGGNDIGLVSTAVGCLTFTASSTTNVCKDRLTAGGVDSMAAAIEDAAPSWGAMLDAVAERAPDARILVVGYGTYLPDGGCFPTQPMLPEDADYIQGSITAMNEALKQQADEHGAEFVDTEPLSVGHDVCVAADQRYFEGVVPQNPAAPLHPTAAGMAAIGAAVASAVRAG
ncbi:MULTISPECIES: SGNH/GDSL hydrolase family protein [unclassified Rhodococcus (in: high G+C Gram-positive bacteria)]|uniref:SGNH/GDSL hydrolase family protein n=1 Tax=unclassified Rhodococcus (in: high G+C Gram-positive bacteria) TaxID=192944 RepID=UPI0029542E91|nr:SGNH/GDSL hydrolase family protein [Rhodococcus sp. IEGM 1343]MDV8054687.1 SGNH/GDSL hydrolase family protein [Rhodococcus sp. IEGM 1343]